MTATEVDVLIVGAGLSGIGAAAHLHMHCPAKSYAVLEARDAIGGTWDLFRYPGVRSDSDMYTLGYSFKPWTGARSIAEGAAIRAYVREAAAEHGVEPHIRFGRKVRRARWSSQAARWTVEAERADGQVERFTCAFLYMCSGYYAYDRGYRPHWPGETTFAGAVVHPQFWPETLDYRGKRVVVIGSGATAVTLVPAMAETAAHVTMLQRSPSYVAALPAVDPVAAALRRWLPATLAYRLVRFKNVLITSYLYRLARAKPQRFKARLLALARQHLGPGHDVETHFNPRYDPWDQRLCLAPDADLFAAVKAGRASVVTDEIETFTPAGLKLKSGAEIAADIIVTATGLELNVLGDVAFDVDGARFVASEAMSYKGVMLSGMPNLAYASGYTNASWTLKADLAAEFVCRLLNHMDRIGANCVTPVRDPSVAPAPIIDFSSGYVQRALHALPKQGARPPWRVHQNYLRDLMLLRFGRIDDGVLSFTAPEPRKAARPAPAPADARAAAK